MRGYTNSFDAISDLHSRGFSNDFYCRENDLAWIQKKESIQIGEFAIVEYHRIEEEIGNFDKCIVLGIIAFAHNIKGILLRRFKSTSIDLPPVLIRKLKEFATDAGSTKNENH